MLGPDRGSANAGRMTWRSILYLPGPKTLKCLSAVWTRLQLRIDNPDAAVTTVRAGQLAGRGNEG